ncbi:flavin monoamine oxidase family protein [Arthrobacter sp. R4]|uniref:flavin monoamine oxidase family protein n=1 Tax=Arthrobacter sp. R4 TaxID=644417 RepID=UPI003EDA65CA
MTTDVLVIGAGFAGLTASRELSNKGYTVQIIEARDRIAGRTWLDAKLGRNLELGGTWVHWAQPHVWAELTRYAIGVVPPADYEKAYWHADGQSFQGSPDELMALLDGPNRELLAPSRALIPLPYEPLSNPAVKAADQQTISERINALNLDPMSEELMRSFWALNFNGRLDDAAFTQALRWCSAACHDWLLMFEVCSAYKIQGGTAALAEAIAADSNAELVLNAPVAEVRQTDSGVVALDRAGNEYRAKKLLVTLPLGALESVRFYPELSSGKRAAARLGQIGMGAKLWIKVKGRHERFVAMGPADWPLNFVQAEYLDVDTTTLVAFGPDGSAVDPEDATAAQELLRRWIPDIEVLEVAGHSWVDDEFAQQTWAMHRTGFLSESLTELQRPEGDIYLAGSDYASGWGGFIDGAIESGLQASMKISNALKIES